MQIPNRVVLITGASEGIGAACAAEFARCGARLVLTSRSEAGLYKAAAAAGAKAEGAGEKAALIVPGDITDEASRQRVVERALERFGAIDILINNAGLGLYAPAWSAPLEEARRLMEINFFAPLALTQLVAPHMRERRTGFIVNIGSIAGKVTLPWMTLYSASKYALGSLTEGMRMELRASGVRTMIVCPGYVKTGFQQHVVSGKPPASMVRGRRYAIEPRECAEAIRRGVERDARTVVTPLSGWALVLASRLFPGLLEARLAEMNGTA
jgi:short-subunit dehydrogenase